MIETEITFVATNLIPADPAGWSVPKHRLITKGGRSVLVLGVLDPVAFAYYRQREGDLPYTIRGPVQSLEDEYSRAMGRKEPDLIVVLSNLGYDQDKALAGTLHFVDVIVGGHSQDRLERPVLVEKTLIVQSGKDGQYMGQLTLTLKNHEVTDHSAKLIPLDLSIADHPDMLNLFHE